MGRAGCIFLVPKQNARGVELRSESSSGIYAASGHLETWGIQKDKYFFRMNMCCDENAGRVLLSRKEPLGPFLFFF